MVALGSCLNGLKMGQVHVYVCSAMVWITHVYVRLCYSLR